MTDLYLVETPRQLYDFTTENFPNIRVMHLLVDAVSNDEWCVLWFAATDADGLVSAKVTTTWVDIRSTPEFEAKYQAALQVRLPLAAFQRFNDTGVGILRFLPDNGTVLPTGLVKKSR